MRDDGDDDDDDNDDDYRAEQQCCEFHPGPRLTWGAIPQVTEPAPHHTDHSLYSHITKASRIARVSSACTMDAKRHDFVEPEGLSDLSLSKEQPTSYAYEVEQGEKSKGVGTKECSRRRCSIQAHLSYIRTRGDACLLAQPLPFPFLVTFYKHSGLYLSIMSSHEDQSSRDSAGPPGPQRKDPVMDNSDATGGGGGATSNDAQTQLLPLRLRLLPV